MMLAVSHPVCVFVPQPVAGRISAFSNHSAVSSRLESRLIADEIPQWCNVVTWQSNSEFRTEKIFRGESQTGICY